MSAEFHQGATTQQVDVHMDLYPRDRAILATYAGVAGGLSAAGLMGMVLLWNRPWLGVAAGLAALALVLLIGRAAKRHYDRSPKVFTTKTDVVFEGISEFRIPEGIQLQSAPSKTTRRRRENDADKGKRR